MTPGISKAAGAFGLTLDKRACIAAILARDALGGVERIHDPSMNIYHAKLFFQIYRFELGTSIFNLRSFPFEDAPHVAASPQVMAQPLTKVVHEVSRPDMLDPTTSGKK